MNDERISLALGEEGPDDARWAFGTGFEDPLHGVATAVPEGVDAARLAACCAALADDALVTAQRLAEWCTDAPELEEELALANIGLDLLGQARLLYSRAGQVDGTGRDENAFAYFRDTDDFRNVRLAELPRGDFAFDMVRLLVLSAWRLALFERLAGAADPVLAAVAAKGVKELAYHRQFAAEWVVRLGDGTEESRERTARALAEVLPWTAELARDGASAPFGADGGEAWEALSDVLRRTADAAGLSLPAPAEAPAGTGRSGDHTQHLAPLVGELQSVAREHPEARW